MLRGEVVKVGEREVVRGYRSCERLDRRDCLADVNPEGSNESGS